MPAVTCLHCGAEFTAKPGRIASGRAKYCSRECSAEARRRTKEVECAWCRKTVPQRRTLQKYCSRTCSAAASHAASGKTPEVRLCKMCGRTFIPRQSGDLYCSKRCHTADTHDGAGFGLFEDPWASGAIPPDRYGKDLYRTPDIWLGF